MIRNAKYAGAFYPSKADSIIESIESCFLNSFGPQKLPDYSTVNEEPIPFVVVPHAGYIYSGPVAAWSYLELSKYMVPDTIIIFGPNHTGWGAEIGVPDKVKTWETPLGRVDIDHKLIDELIAENSKIKRNDHSHENEHSIEVQIPFLQYILKKSFKLVPIVLLNQGYDSSMMLGETIGNVIEDRNIAIIASSDLTHYESHSSATNKDTQVLKAIEKMDAKEMYNLKYNLSITMCGYGPIAATIEAAKRTGRTHGKLLQYANSGDTSGQKSQVVGYGSVIFCK
jgi:AmmeMemoRadiSam system protein B